MIDKLQTVTTNSDLTIKNTTYTTNSTSIFTSFYNQFQKKNTDKELIEYYLQDIIDDIIEIQKKNKNIIKIQSLAKKCLSNKKLSNNFNENLIKLITKKPNIMKQCFIKILKVLKKYPPAKNENKFVYGKVCELILITCLDIFLKCIQLDEKHNYGSEYKNDCMFQLLKKKYSIKVQKSKNLITIINKRNKNTHSINGMNFLIVNIKLRKLFIFTHTEKDFGKYVKEDGAGIHYKGSIITYLNKNKKYYYEFPETKDFEENELPYIKEENIYQRIYEEL